MTGHTCTTRNPYGFLSDNIDPYFFLVQLLAEKEEYNEAEKYLSLAIKKFPKSEYYFSQRGTILILLERYDEAITDLSKAIEFNSNNGENYFFRAFAYLSKKQINKACTDFQKAKSLNFEPANLYIEKNCK